MLKYQYNEAKEKTFLTFWNMKNLEEWEKLQKNFSFIFLKILSLDEEIKHLLSQLIQQNFSTEKIEVKKQTLNFKQEPHPITTTLLEEKKSLLEKLDTYNIIAFTKSNPLKKDSNSEWKWEKWFTIFLTNFYFFKNKQEVFSFLTELEDFTEANNLTIEEKEILKTIFDDVVLQDNHFLQEGAKRALNNLYKKKIITYFFLQEEDFFTFKITINPSFLKLPQANFLFKKLFSPNKIAAIPLPQILLYLDKSLFEEQTKSRLNTPNDLLKEEQISFLNNALLHLKKNEYDKKKYLQLSYKQKIFFIMKLILQNYFFLMEKLIKLKNPIFSSEKEFLFFIKKTICLKNTTKEMDENFSWINAFFYLGVVQKKDNGVIINQNFQEIFNQKNEEDFLVNSNLIIDIDMSITVFKEKLHEELDYYLSIFCQKKNHTYSVSFEIDQKFSAFAWFLNFDYPKMVALFKKYQQEKLSEEFREYLKLFFEGCEYYREKKYHALKIPSTLHYNQFKFYLTQKKIISRVMFNDKEKVVIFFSSQDYQDLLAKNQVEKKFKFF